uniref:primase-like DNA-binding domain-containing protein n=1 Tax=Shigella boydii TaxID=621 RepID=UPI000A8B1127
ISPRQPSGKNIIRWLLKKRTNGSVRYCQYTSLLLEQRDGDEALAIKQQTDPVIEFCQFLNFLEEARGLMMGGGGDSVKYTTRNSLYRVYLAFMAYAGRSKPLNVNDFGKAMKPAAKVYGHEYITRKVKGVTQTNAITTDECDAFL